MRLADLTRPFRDHPGLWVALACGTALKAIILITHSITFDADEAILGLMARHILLGERPIFFYGQSYMGALDAYLIAFAFLIMGQTVLVMRLVQVGLYLGVLATTYLLSYRLTANRFSATASALMVGLPPVMFSLYTTSTLGDYVETLLLSNLLFLVVWDILAGRKDSGRWWLVAGILAGVGWWSMALIIVTLIPLAILGLRKLQGRLRAGKLVNLVLGFALGAAPWITATIQRGPAATLTDLSGAWFTGSIGDGAIPEILYRLIWLVAFTIPALLGIRPSWSLDWVLLPLGVAVAAFYAFVLWRAARLGFSNESRSTLLRPEPMDARLIRQSLLLVWVVLVVLLIVTPFGGDPTGRYLLPLWPVLSVLVGEHLGRLRWNADGHSLPGRQTMVAGILSVVLVYNLWGNMRSVWQNPPGLTKQFDPISQIPHDHDEALIEFLDTIGADRGYSNYWVTFRIAFLTQEGIIFSPRLPYKADMSYTYGDDRYPSYGEAVDQASNPVYITSNHPRLDAAIHQRLLELGISFQVRRIGPYTVFYQLSQRVTPDDLGPFGEVSGSGIHGEP